MFGQSNQPVDPQTHVALEHAQAQRNFALMVFIFSFFLLLIVSLSVMSQEEIDTQMVFTTITTLVGTWVGTLLAFFYSRENFESASRSMQETIARLGPTEKLQSTPVADAMIDRSEMVRIELKRDQKLETLLLSELVAKFKADELVTRLPILNPDGSIAAILHESLLNLYLRDNPDPNGTATLGDFAKSQDNAKMLKLFGVVARDRTLRDAKAAMESQKKCQDVFVTANGGVGESVVGWITDGRILLALDA
jgi:hypothetical protein